MNRIAKQLLLIAKDTVDPELTITKYNVKGGQADR